MAVVAALQVAGWLVYDAVREEPTARELTEKCLRNEKRLEVGAVERDVIAQSAAGGGIELKIEGNGVRIVFAGSTEEAARLVSSYEAVGSDLAGRLELRGRIVYLWEFVSSPTQRQTVYDCWYG